MEQKSKTQNAREIANPEWLEYIKGKENPFLESLEKDGADCLEPNQMQMIRDELISRNHSWRWKWKKDLK